MKRGIVIGSLLAAVLIVGGCASADEPTLLMVDPNVPEADLLAGALAIEQDQDAVLVPATRPSELDQMGTSGIADGAHGVYFRPKSTGVEVFALFDDQPVATCADGHDDTGVLCVRNGRVGDRHVAIYFSADGDAAAYTTATVKKMRDFWAATPLVAPSAAPWFTDLAARGHAAEI
ncbi:MAG: hypothetical protein ABW046_04065 [Actinoplanes sp.]